MSTQLNNVITSKSVSYDFKKFMTSSKIRHDVKTFAMASKSSS